MSSPLFEPHPVTGYRFIPNLRARVPHEGGGYDVHCNRAGYRCRHELTPDKPPGTFRLLVFGDGHTAGTGVDDADRFTDRLERRLGGYVQVLNFGLPGSGTDQQLLAYRQHAREIEHDLVLLCPQVENIGRNLVSVTNVPSANPQGDPLVFAHMPKPRFSLDGDELVLHPPPAEADDEGDPVGNAIVQGPPPTLVRGWLRRMTAEVDKKVPGFHSFTQRVRGLAYPEQYATPTDPAWRLMRTILATWIAEAKAPVVLAPIPSAGHVEGSALSDAYLMRFGELAVDAGCELVNLLPMFFDLPRAMRQRCRFPVDPRPTAQGHELFAEGLVPHLRPYLP